MTGQLTIGIAGVDRAVKMSSFLIFVAVGAPMGRRSDFVLSAANFFFWAEISALQGN